MNGKKQKAYFKGLIAEVLISQILSFSDYIIVANRLHTVFAEIDIVAINHNIQSLKFIEVKYRKNFRSFDETISYKQIENLKLASEYIIQKNFFYYPNLNSSIEIWFVSEIKIDIFSI